jgi:cytochrome c peroxidase
MKTIMKVVFSFMALGAVVAAGCSRSTNPYALAPDEVTAKQRLAKLGRALFFDESLSSPGGQSCATCHAPSSAFTDPRGGLPTSKGADAALAGVRNTPSAMYAAFVPALHYSTEDDTFVGGLFLDGRVDSLEAQAHKPLLNPIEMGNADAAAIAGKLRAAPYAYLFRNIWGSGALDDDNAAFDNAAAAIAAFERGTSFAPFTSKYDAYLAGNVELSPAEARGLVLFNDEKKGNCAACHPSAAGDDGAPPMFTDFTYDNIGIPRNTANPFYALPAAFNADGAAYVDRGLGVTVGDAKQDGKFRVPTLRNIALTAPYGHNGYFADLRSIVDFYNTRDTRPWPKPEIAATMNPDELGHLGMSDAEVDDLVAFLYTLSDGWTP